MNRPGAVIEEFRPPWFLRNGHLQTIITGFYKPKPNLPTPIEHKLSLEDKGFGLVFENRPLMVSQRHHDEAVLLLHGLGSSHAGTYMTTIAKHLIERGVRVFRADLPGAGASGKWTPLPPHGACYPEVWRMLNELRTITDIRRWRIAGVSLGANILLKMLARIPMLPVQNTGDAKLEIVKGIAIAPPVQLDVCCRNIERGVHRLYADYFIRALRQQALERGKIWPQWANQLKFASFKTIRLFDETMTAPLAGFRNAEEYYHAGSSWGELDQIMVPTSILIDDHDPIVPASIFETAHFSKTTKLFRTRFGGHVGYMQHAARVRNAETGNLPNSKWMRWLDQWIVNELLSENDPT